MALSVTQSMNMSFLNSLLPKQETSDPGLRQPVTITSITASLRDSFDRQISSSLRVKALTLQGSFSSDSILVFSSGGKQHSFGTYNLSRESSILQISAAARQGTANGGNAAAGAAVDAGWSVGVNAGEEEAVDPNDQRSVNRDQARQIKDQLKLSGGVDWGVDSLGEDLAVFGLDFTAMNGDPEELKQTIRAKAQEMVDELDRNAANDSDYDARRRVVSGACARLLNGLGSAGGGSAAAAGASAAGKSVTVGGASVDAGFIISVGNVLADPLVLDLAGDGLNLKGADKGVQFDMDGDGEKTTMGFIQGDDALLFVDSRGDGLVHDATQLFGNNDGYANGFEKLRAYDDNADGVIDAQDAVYDSLRVWVEKTVDGVSEEGETMSLREAGVASINVGYENVREDDGTGNLVGQKGSFTRDDGTAGLAADVWFQELR